jgi:hypothetical protein
MKRILSQVAKKKALPKTRLGLPDLNQVKAAMLGSLRSAESQRGYRRPMEEFILRYCPELRLSFTKAVVTRYRIYLNGRRLVPGERDRLLRKGAVTMWSTPTQPVRLAALRNL